MHRAEGVREGPILRWVQEAVRASLPLTQCSSQDAEGSRCETPAGEFSLQR
jgi:hypothetical protein